MIFEQKLRQALKLELPHSERPASEWMRGDEAQAAVMILFGEGPVVLMTRRTETVETHKGQYAFPGGRVDPEDRDPVMTALRETEEEVGIPPAAIRIVGELPGLWTPTGYWITPIVGVLNSALHETRLVMSPDETAEAFWIQWSALTEPGIYRKERFANQGRSYMIHSFQLGDRRIWGATGAMLKNLLDRLQSLG